MINFCGRRIYVNTKTKSQTVNVCTAANRRGVYERVYRFTPPVGTRDDVGTLIRRIQGNSLNDLYGWLEHHNATREPGRGGNSGENEGENTAEPISITRVVNELVSRRLPDFGLEAAGQDYKSRDHWIVFSRLLQTSPERVEQAIASVLTDILAKLRLEADSAAASARVSGSSRGNLRQETALSSGRIKAVINAQCLEEVLERAIVCIMTRLDERGDWFNQLNVAGGFLSQSAKHLDIVRRPTHSPKTLQIIELKGWPDAEHPLAAAIQVFVYVAMTISLGVMKRDKDLDWPEIEKITMYLAAPTAWFHDFSRDGNPSNATQCFSRAVARVSDLLWAPFKLDLEFCPTPIEINLDRHQFVSMFQNAARKNHHSVCDAISQDDQQILAQCFGQAFQPII